VSGYIQAVDPFEMANRYSNEDAIDYGESEEVDFQLREEHLSEVKLFLEQLPPREADLVQMYYFWKMTQKNIAKVFGISQAAVSYRLNRAIKRIKFLLAVPKLDPDEIREDLSVYFELSDVQIFEHLYQTTCLSKTAEIMGLTQGCVRHRFLRNLDRLGKISTENEYYGVYQKAYHLIRNNFNILREVKLPRWSDRPTCSIA
jgi:predicted XRE-type DNA-binding protein